MYLITIVLYNKNPEDSSTINSLSRLTTEIKNTLRIIVWDNSPMPFNDSQRNTLSNKLNGINTIYRHNNGENMPLSRIYNLTIKELQNNECLVILDDDSEFDNQFFEKATTAILKHDDIDLFLPIVHTSDNIVSPAYMYLFKGHYFKSVKPGIMTTKNTTAINSGMIIRARYLKHDFEGYDENIKFYFTDNDFMSKYDASHQSLVVIDYHMHHTLNFYQRGEEFSKKKARFKDLRHSFLILMRRKGIAIYLITVLYMFIYSIKFAIIHKDIRYIFIR